MPPRKKKSDDDDQPHRGLRQLPVAPVGLEGCEAAEPEIVRWVARNIDNPNPSVADCPDPFAWTLLRTVRDDPTYLGFFVEKLWAKLIPSRSQLDNAAPQAMDGKPTVDLIERIQRMRNEAEAPVVKKPSAFEQFDPTKETL